MNFSNFAHQKYQFSLSYTLAAYSEVHATFSVKTIVFFMIQSVSLTVLFAGSHSVRHNYRTHVKMLDSYRKLREKRPHTWKHLKSHGNIKLSNGSILVVKEAGVPDGVKTLQRCQDVEKKKKTMIQHTIKDIHKSCRVILYVNQGFLI